MSDDFSASRRIFVLGLASSLAGCGTLSDRPPIPPASNPRKQAARDIAEDELEEWLLGFINDEPFDVPTIDLRKLPAEMRRTTVRYDGPEKPGTIVVDIAGRHAYLVGRDGHAIRYGVGVGEEGNVWRGDATIGRKAKWPGWWPTPKMRAADPALPAFMPGGVLNPLGARALYIYQGGTDTLFRLHGTDEPWSIGEEESSGCIRFLNEDILDLYKRVDVGTTVVLKDGGRRRG